MPIKDWSVVPANNNASPPLGAPEGWVSSDVNNWGRQVMADVRSAMEALPWFDWGDAPTYVAADSFSLVGDLSARYGVGLRIRATAPLYTITGTITASAYGSVTTVTVAWDGAGALDATVVGVGIGGQRFLAHTDVDNNFAVPQTSPNAVAAGEVVNLGQADGRYVQPSITLPDSQDLDLVVVSGFYRLSTDIVNGPPESVNYSQMIVCRGSDTIYQMIGAYYTGSIWTRVAKGIGGTPIWTPWVKTAVAQNDNNFSVPQTVPTATAAGHAVNLGQAQADFVPFETVLPTSQNLNTVIKSGAYRIGATPVNAPVGITADDSQMQVIHGGGDTISQMIFLYGNSNVWTRSGSPTNVGGSNGWGVWRRLGFADSPAFYNMSVDTTSGARTSPTVFTKSVANIKVESEGSINFHYGWFTYSKLYEMQVVNRSPTNIAAAQYIEYVDDAVYIYLNGSILWSHAGETPLSNAITYTFVPGVNTIQIVYNSSGGGDAALALHGTFFGTSDFLSFQPYAS